MSKRQGAPVPPSASLEPPPLPYVTGAQFEIKSHNPPPPLDNGSGYKHLDDWNPDPWPLGDGAPKGIVAKYLAHPQRNTTPPEDRSKHDLVITQQIRCGKDCLAQVVRCLVDGKERVAKIFDPLYVGNERCIEDGFPPTYFSERSYSCEAAAYKRIKESGLDGKHTPKFYGCWCLELPFADGKGNRIRREVRLILQEFIPGDTIEALVERGEADKIHPDTRVELLDRLMEAITHLTFIGVRNDDEHPRNFMVTIDEEKKWRIVLIDFSHSRVRDLPNSKWWTTNRTRGRKKPENPMTTLNACWPPGCSGWIPKKCDGRSEASLDKRFEHMKERWGTSDDYEAPDQNEVDRLYGPKYRL